jgi:hypothetical protein
MRSISSRIKVIQLLAKMLVEIVLQYKSRKPNKQQRFNFGFSLLKVNENIDADYLSKSTII